MKRTSHPLDDEFEAEEALEEDVIEVEVPENAELRDVANLAMSDYKETKESMLYIEPSKRAKFLDLMNSFLTTAKDALDKIEKNEIQRQRAANSSKNKPTKTSSGEEGGRTISRSELESGNLKLVNGDKK